MSWKKGSPAIGLSGLMLRVAAREALISEDFQKMPDPWIQIHLVLL